MPYRNSQSSSDSALKGCLYSSAFLSPLSIALGQLALFATLIFILIVYMQRRQNISTTFMVASVFAYVSYILVMSAIWPLISNVGHYEASVEAIRWVRSGPVAVLVVALALLNTDNWRRTWFVSVTILFAATCLSWIASFNTNEFLSALSGSSRYQSSVQLFIASMKAGIIAVFSILALYHLHFKNPNVKAIVGLTMLITTLLMLSFVVAMKSRGLWVGTALAAILAIWYGSKSVKFYPEQASIVRKSNLILFTLAIALGALFVDQIQERWEQHQAFDNLNILATEEMESWEEEIGRNSLGIRAALVKYGITYIADRPFFGYGPSEIAYIDPSDVRQSPVLSDTKGHYHNFLIEFAIKFGVIGLILWLIPFAKAIYETWKSPGLTREDSFIRGFLLSSGVLILFYGLTDVHLDRFSVFSFYAFIFSPLFAYALSEKSRGCMGRSNGEGGLPSTHRTNSEDGRDQADSRCKTLSIWGRGRVNQQT